MENAISRASALNRIALALGEAGDKQQELAALTQAVEVAEEMALASNLIFSIAMTLATDPVTEYKQDDLTHPAARRMKKAFTANEKQLAKQLVEAMQEN